MGFRHFSIHFLGWGLWAFNGLFCFLFFLIFKSLFIVIIIFIWFNLLRRVGEDVGILNVIYVVAKKIVTVSFRIRNYF